MNFDAKQKILLRLYLEYQKDIPDMAAITAESMNMDMKTFLWTIRKLENETLIADVNYARAGDRLILTFMETAAITPCGIQYIEEKFEIPSKLSSLEKIEKLNEQADSWNWESGKTLVEHLLAELA